MKSTVPVWGTGIRLLHWLLAIGIALAWCFSAGTGDTHACVGYCVAGIILLRFAWGVRCGPRSARLSRSLRVARRSPSYVADMAAGCERRYLGHNPLGSLMVMALLSMASAVCLTGWLYTTDWLWGYGWLARLHHLLAWVLMALVALHVAGVLYTSRRERQNLLGAMFSGRKQRASTKAGSR
jgi:cytochrome b